MTSFSDTWHQIATRKPQAFDTAQHAFIEHTRYNPVVALVQDSTGAAIGDCLNSALTGRMAA